MAGEQTIGNDVGGRKNGDGGFCIGERRRENGDGRREIGGQPVANWGRCFVIGEAVLKIALRMVAVRFGV